LHELAHELAPVTTWFRGFVLCWCFFVCFVLVGLVLVGVWLFFGGDFIAAFWPVTVHF